MMVLSYLMFHLLCTLTTGLTLTRSRPYQKNDNRFVEQKNATLVRAYLGHVRLDTRDQTDVLNVLYEDMWVYYNLFQPVLRLREKAQDGPRVLRRWDPAQTPFARLRATKTLNPAQQEQLEQRWATTNPRSLRQTIYQRLAQLLQAPAPRIMWEVAA